MTVNEHAIDFLGSLERAEVALLGWGMVDGFFTEEELERRAEDFLDTRRRRDVDPGYTTGWELVEALRDDHLLWQLPADGRCRTRMAEAVRLFARLRQIFPDVLHSAWRTAPTLIADYRFLLRARTYPRRDIRPGAVVTALRRDVALGPLDEDVVRALVRADSPDERLLAAFQLRAAVRVLRSAGVDRVGGTVVCAGTGSGKTLAFYLPAYVAIARRLSSEHWTKCLAIYPRNELLKDQLREALANARRIAPALAAHGRRRLVLGALYGDVPNRAANLLEQPDAGARRAWRPVRVLGAAAFECPVVRCPTCNDPMAWLEADIRERTERLVCTRPGCHERVEPQELRLTRESMIAAPPDVLFTTTEMMNQRMASSRFERLLGIGVAKAQRPDFVLLDEVHTYEGTHGAHVALLLRRWRAASGARPHFVGLSATLADAPRFFSDLTGIGPGDVAEILPAEAELTAEGMEYLLALRGDPSSGTSLLSATIQALMLARRILAPDRGAPQYGSRVFAFTDNLDVVNRLYHNLLDAEGWDTWSTAPRPNPRRPEGSLANLRAPTLPNGRERFEAGQNWALPHDIGNLLVPGSRIVIGRTDSQDPGVDAAAGVVVATASLEVGFDDPDVGAILQHKAPHSAAAFLQRKGRAGRRRGTRPWTIAVLSDYGRDRSAYQSYEQLFSPELPPQRLPLGNRAVLRMQASYALMEWLAGRLPPGSRAEPWSDLSQPASTAGRYADTVRERQRRYAASLRSLLEQPSVRAEFSHFLARTFGIDDPEAVGALLWEPPRALLTEVVPTLLRRLEREWHRADGDGLEHYVARAPLPEFVPRTLFSDLQLPEALIRLPALGRIRARLEAMPLAQALREYAPGRVSRRFGVAHGGERHWVDPGDGATLSIDRFCPPADRQELGRFAYYVGDRRVELPVFRPWALDLSVPPVNVEQSANSFLSWHAEIVPTGDGHEVDVPEGSAWRTLLEPCRFHTHHLGLPVEVRRFAPSTTAAVRMAGEHTTERRVQFVCTGPGDTIVPAALGFVADVDAIQITFHPPPRLYAACEGDGRLARGLRPLRFRDLIRVAPELDGIANGFQRDWLAQAYLSAVVVQALRSGDSLRDAEEVVRRLGPEAALAEVLETILQWTDSEDDAADGAPVGEGPPRRLRELLETVGEAGVWDALHTAAQALWAPIDGEWEQWLRARFKATLGAAIAEAAQGLCPRTDSGALILDLDGGPNVGRAVGAERDELWLSESTLGGAGFVEEFLVRYAEDPRRYFRLLEAELGPSDFETVGADLDRIVAIAASGAPEHAEVAAAFAGVRAADSHEESVRALEIVRAALTRQGIVPTPTLLVSMNARLLRPGTSLAVDAFLAHVLEDWRRDERRLGIDVDARVFAVVKSVDDGLERALGINPVGQTERARALWRYSVLCGLLWPRGAQLRLEALRGNSPYARLPDTDRLLVLAAVARPAREVLLAEDNWFDRLADVLARGGDADLVGAATEPDVFASALLRVASEPLDVAGLLMHARLAGVRRDGDRLCAAIELPEAVQ
jgi:hypothetical protein